MVPNNSKCCNTCYSKLNNLKDFRRPSHAHSRNSQNQNQLMDSYGRKTNRRVFPKVILTVIYTLSNVIKGNAGWTNIH